MPATPSARPNGGSVGGPSSCPVWWANPLIASARVPKARRCAYGPSCPNPVTRSITRRGLCSSSCSGPSPHSSITPGREVLHQHVGVRHQPTEHVLALWLTEVERHRSLVARDDLPPHAVSLPVPAMSS